MISTTDVTCGYLPPADYLDGPLNGTAVRPLRRNAEKVHPSFRTAEGKAVRGEVPPDDPHYTHSSYGHIVSLHDAGGYYEWVPCLGPSVDHSCTTCGLTEDTTTCEGLFFNHKGKMGCEDPRCQTPGGPPRVSQVSQCPKRGTTGWDTGTLGTGG